MFYLDRFADVDLPLFEARQTISSGTSLSTFRQLQDGGAYRVRGNERSPRQMQTITTSGEFVVETPVDMIELARALYGERGKLGKLYRRLWSGERHWCWAELLSVGAELGPPSAFVQPVAPEFQMISASWFGGQHGAAWRWGEVAGGDDWGSGVVWDQAEGDSFDILASRTNDDFLIENGGNVPVDNAILTISASATHAITDLQIITEDPEGLTDGWLIFNADVPATKNLVIDCGAKRITIDNVSVYSDLEIGAAHKLAGWLRLYPGTTTITLGYSTGADGTLLIEFSEGHE
jgi:hypothetical protein